MRKPTLLLGIVMSLVTTLLLVGAGSASSAPAPKVDVCHVDGQGVVHLINVSANALPAHLAHGDALPGPLALPAGTTFSASNSWGGPTYSLEKAFDGDLVNFGWNAGGFPTNWIQVDFGSPQRFSAISAVVDQLPDGITNHDVALDGAPAFSWSGYTENLDVLSHTFATMQTAQTVRITTTVSPSWVAWREIQLIGC